MVQCHHCQHQLEEGAKFCEQCGTKVLDTIQCPQCSKEMSKEFAFCQSCGANLQEQAVEEVVETADEPSVGADEQAAEEPVVEPSVGADEQVAEAPVVEPSVGADEQAAEEPVVEPSVEAIEQAADEPVVEPSTEAVEQAAEEPVVEAQPVIRQAPAGGAAEFTSETSEKGPSPTQSESVATTISQTLSKLPKKAMLIAASVIGVIIIAAVLISTLANKSNDKQHLFLYLKDNELNYSHIKNLEPTQLTTRLYDETLSVYEGRELGSYVQVSHDEKKIFFPDRVRYSDDGYNLYHSEVGVTSAEPVRIDTNVLTYRINKKADKVFYIKGPYDSRSLYVYDFNDKERIDNDVDTFYINESGSTIIYSKEGTIYKKEGDQTKDRIDSDSSIVYVAPDLSVVYYLKDESLYMKKGDDDRLRIDNDVSWVIKVYESGEIYYVKSEYTDLKLSTFVEDDYMQEDSQLVEPIEPHYPYFDEFFDWDKYDYWDEAVYDEYYASMDRYNEAIDRYYDEYDLYSEALRVYWDKLDRDELRADLDNNTVSFTEQSLFYYNGETSVAITDEYSSYSSMSKDKPAIVYYKSSPSERETIKLSEIYSIYDVYSIAQLMEPVSSDAYLLVEDKEILIEHDDAFRFTLNEDASALYYVDNYSDSSSRERGDLYIAEIKDGKLEAATVYDEDVYPYYWFELEGSLVYFKDYRTNSYSAYDMTADLYVDKKLIDYEVSIYSVDSLPDKKSWTYFTDYNEDREHGTLKLYTPNDDKPLQISEGVHDFVIINQDNIAYLTDYNVNRERGDAYLYNGSEERITLDTDVKAIIQIKLHDSDHR